MPPIRLRRKPPIRLRKTVKTRQQHKESAMRTWFTMKKAEDDGKQVAEIMIYDSIGSSFWDEDTVSAASFVAALKDLGDVSEIKLRINSPGGDVFDSVAIYNAIKNHKAKVTAHVDGLAASGASFIAMAAERIVMPSNAFMLVHNASGMAMGMADDMRSMANDLDRIDGSMRATYAARSRQTDAKVKALMKEDRLMDAKEAKELGFADEITAPVKIAASFSLHLLPKAAAERFRAVTGTEQGDPPQPAPVPEGPGGQPVAPPVPPPSPPAQPGKTHGEPEPRLPADPFHLPGPTPTPPAPTPAATAEVIDINAAKKQGLEEHQLYVGAITDLCTLARVPERVGGYVRAAIPVEQVRRELLDMTAQAPVLSQHPLATTKPAAAAWAAITDKLNARMK
jgi:ATP-dependent Clp protease protease subunit